MFIRNDDGFTVLETLLVALLLGILSALSITVINFQSKRVQVQNSVREHQLEKIVQGIEAFRVAEGKYPVDTNNNGNPTDDLFANPTIRSYITAWPGPTTDYYYRYYTEGGISFLCVSARMNSATPTAQARHFKYVYPYDAMYSAGGNPTCAGRILRDCRYSANSANRSNDFNLCNDLSLNPC